MEPPGHPDQPRPPFLVDAMLGNVARELRLLGFDAAFAGRLADAEVLRAAQREGRVLVTRDASLAARARTGRAVLVSEPDPAHQTAAVLRLLGLRPALRNAFTRCLRCNAPLAPLRAEEAFPRVPDHVASAAPGFLACPGCGRTYWPGTHAARLRARIREIVGVGRPGGSPLPAVGGRVTSLSGRQQSNRADGTPQSENREPMRTHLEESLQRDVDRIRAKVAEMCDLVEKALRGCITALVEGDRQLNYAVILRDEYIDEKEKELDRLCLEFLVRQQPVASMLRLAYSTIKINQELEQVGDYAENIARQSLKLGELSPAVPKERFVEIADLSITMLHDAIQAFVRQDADLARRTMAVEETVDGLKSSLNADLVELFREEKIPFEALRPLTTVARRLERVSDRARYICLEVLYMCTGEYAKHQGSEMFRVLFVDVHNACRSQMAEAIANGLNLPQFVFASAGIDPTALDPHAVAFMREKDYDISRMAPKAIFQVPHLDHYQVLVGLDPEVSRTLPHLPRKMIFLDWSGKDPARVTGSAEERQAAFEETYEFIHAHIRSLVDAIIGTNEEAR